jgi:hypothetical protein
VEIAGAAVINLAMLVFLWAALPIGPLLAAIAAALVIRRALRGLPAANTDVALQRA